MKQGRNDICKLSYKMTVFDDITISPYHSKSVKSFFNSDNLLIKEIFYKDDNCTNPIVTISNDYKNSQKICTTIFMDINWKQVTVFDKYNRVLNSIIYLNGQKYVQAINKYRADYYVYEKIRYNDNKYNYIVSKYNNNNELVDKKYYKINAWNLFKIENFKVVILLKIIALVLSFVIFATVKSIILGVVPLIIFFILSIDKYKQIIETPICINCNRHKNDVVKIIRANQANYVCIDCLNKIIKMPKQESDGSIFCNFCDNLIFPGSEYVTNGKIFICKDCLNVSQDIIEDVKSSL